MARGNGQLWTAAEEEYLRDNYGVLSTDVLSEQMGRKPNAVRSRAFQLGLTTRRLSKEQEDEAVTLYETGLLMKEVAASTGLREGQVRRILRSRGISTDRSRAAKAAGRPKRKLTDEEKATVRKMRHEGASLASIRGQLGCSKETLRIELPLVADDGQGPHLIGERLRKRFTQIERRAMVLLARERSQEVVADFFQCSRRMVRRTLREEGVDPGAFKGQHISRVVREQYRTGRRKVSHRAGRGMMTYGPSPFQGMVRFRSRTEARRAAELTAQKHPWLYEARRYPLSDGRGYTPDFWIFDCDRSLIDREIGGRPWRHVIEDVLQRAHVLEDVKPWWSPTHPSFDKITQFSREHTQRPFRIMVMPDAAQEGKYGRVREEVWLCQ